MFNRDANYYIETKHRKIPGFLHDEAINIDRKTVSSFGEEWSKFNAFSEAEIESQAIHYFDIIPPGLLTKSTVLADFGCGSGKFSKYMSRKAGTVYSIDPSKAILVADEMLAGTGNVVLCQASISDLPFEDQYFDFGMSIGVLHHIPDSAQAMKDCVQKIKVGGHFLTYIYYSFDNRGWTFKAIWKMSEIVRRIVSSLPPKLKLFASDVLALVVYMPLILFSRFLKVVGVAPSIWKKIPLSVYVDKSFFIIRNDCLDRFGTPLEKRFSKNEIRTMMSNAGLGEILFSDQPGYWHAIGKRIV